MLTFSDALQLAALCLALPSFLVSIALIIQAALKYARAKNEAPAVPTQDGANQSEALQIGFQE
jgi:hypothetical protein